MTSEREASTHLAIMASVIPHGVLADRELRGIGLSGRVGLLVQLPEKLSAADEHAVLTRGTPFEANEIFVFASVASHFDGDIAHLERAAVQQSDAEAADFPCHSRDGASASRDDFSGDRKVQSLSGTFVVAVSFADVFEDLLEVVESRAAPRISGHLKLLIGQRLSVQYGL